MTTHRAYLNNAADFPERLSDGQVYELHRCACGSMGLWKVVR